MLDNCIVLSSMEKSLKIINVDINNKLDTYEKILLSFQKVNFSKTLKSVTTIV